MSDAFSAPIVSAAQAGATTVPVGTPKFSEEPVVWIHHWNPSLMSLRVRRDPAYRFAPGQFARIGLKRDDGEIIWRAYSIVSAPEEAFLEFFLVVVPTGEFSARVAKLKVGNAMFVDKVAQGFLTADRFKDGRDLWLMATGTGLAPYISMVRDDAVWQQFENIIIVQSVRERGDLAYVDELTAMSKEESEVPRAKLKFVSTLTRDHADGALEGRIPALINSGALEKAATLSLTDEHSRFMLCGNPEMVENMRALLKAKGFRMNRKLEPGHIIVENYW
jgi:ferredoxin/flavodoxin---NADP+ reductase